MFVFIGVALLQHCVTVRHLDNYIWIWGGLNKSYKWLVQSTLYWLTETLMLLVVHHNKKWGESLCMSSTNTSLYTPVAKGLLYVSLQLITLGPFVWNLLLIMMQCIDITVVFPTAEETLILVCLDAPTSELQSGYLCGALLHPRSQNCWAASYLSYVEMVNPFNHFLLTAA